MQHHLQVERLLAAAGGRRYLLESADFWALSELEDLSKGAFSELPRFLAAAAQRSTALATSTLLTAAGAQSIGGDTAWLAPELDRRGETDVGTPASSEHGMNMRL